ncbi:MAG: phosphoglycerate dehydrogenase [Firmicutes bacterium]|nr:phosphoglycerate dehydrogenase [Bacillota bacterium]
MSRRVLITPRSFGSASPQARRMLEENGWEIVPNPSGGTLSPEQLSGLIRGVDALIVGIDPVDATVLARADSLRIISKYGSGVNNIDLAAARQMGIAVANVPQANVNAVADATIGAMIALARSFIQADASTRRGEWKRFTGTELWQKNLGIVGLGAIGKAVAKRARGLEMRIVAFDPFVDEKAAEALGVRPVSLEELLASSDFVSLHCPLTEETRGLIGAAQLGLMKKSAYLINFARGGIVDEAALVQALRAGTIAGAAVDAYEQEPPPQDHPLFGLDNVLVFPHMGAHTWEAIDAMSVAAARNVVEFFQTGTCANLVVPPPAAAGL